MIYGSIYMLIFGSATSMIYDGYVSTLPVATGAIDWGLLNCEQIRCQVIDTVKTWTTEWWIVQCHLMKSQTVMTKWFPSGKIPITHNHSFTKYICIQMYQTLNRIKKTLWPITYSHVNFLFSRFCSLAATKTSLSNVVWYSHRLLNGRFRFWWYIRFDRAWAMSTAHANRNIWQID